jgi:uncharacterized protein
MGQTVKSAEVELLACISLFAQEVAMSSETDNVDLLRTAYQRWHDSKGGSIDHWLSLMTDDVKFRSLADGAAPMAFTRRSTCKDDVKRYFAGLSADWEMDFYRIDEYIAQSDRVVALGSCSFNHKQTGKTLKTRRPTSTNSAPARSANSSNFTTRPKRSAWPHRIEKRV